MTLSEVHRQLLQLGHPKQCYTTPEIWQQLWESHPQVARFTRAHDAMFEDNIYVFGTIVCVDPSEHQHKLARILNRWFWVKDADKQTP